MLDSLLRGSVLQSAVVELAPWGRRFADAGGWKLYLVGGILRDLLRGMEFASDTEVDMTTDARPDDVEKVLEGWADAVWSQGKRFGTVGCRKDGRIVEITTHRAEAYEKTSRKPLVVFGEDVYADLSRRDFTINAMAVQLPAVRLSSAARGDAASKRTEFIHPPELIDPYGGEVDLERRVLSTPLEPEVSFADDPLRMLRAARFAASLDVKPTLSVKTAMTNLAARLQIVSSERISAELTLLLLGENPDPGVRLMVETGLLGEILGRSASASGLFAPLQISSLPASLPVRLAALLWGTEDTEETLRRLKFPVSVARESAASARSAALLLSLASQAEAGEGLGLDAASDAEVSPLPPVPELAAEESEFRSSEQISDSTVRRWVAAAVPVAGQALELAMTAASGNAVAEDVPAQKRCCAWLNSFAERFRSLDDVEKLTELPATLTGEEIMAELDIPPGPAVGAALRYLEELRIAEGPQQPDAAKVRLREWHGGRR